MKPWGDFFLLCARLIVKLIWRFTNLMRMNNSMTGNLTKFPFLVTPHASGENLMNEHSWERKSVAEKGDVKRKSIWYEEINDFINVCRLQRRFSIRNEKRETEANAENSLMSSRRFWCERIKKILSPMLNYVIKMIFTISASPHSHSRCAWEIMES